MIQTSRQGDTRSAALSDATMKCASLNGTRGELDMILKGSTRDIAESIAREKSSRVLILSGRLDGHNGLPNCLVQYGDGVKLRALGSYTSSVPTGIFEVIDDDALCAVIDELQSQGGYRATVINPNGERDPNYAL